MLAEPLLVATLVEDAVLMFEKHILHGSHSPIGFCFEQYLALRAADFSKCIENAFTECIKLVEAHLGEFAKRTQKATPEKQKQAALRRK